jgi:acyl-[acyl-carrier-protein] desaturase
MEFFVEKRREVMSHIEKFMLEKMYDFLKPVDTIWQPSDFLPDSSRDTFFNEIKELQESAAGLSYDLIAVLGRRYHYRRSPAYLRIMANHG